MKILIRDIPEAEEISHFFFAGLRCNILDLGERSVLTVIWDRLVDAHVNDCRRHVGC